MKTSHFAVLLAGMSFSGLGQAFASPVLQAEVIVTGEIVTVGDMFLDAGAMASRPLFRAPLPSTTGTVTLAEIEEAAARAGLEEFDANGLGSVAVSRAGHVVTAEALADLVQTDLKNRGALGAELSAEISFDQELGELIVPDSDVPVSLLSYRARPDEGFEARFLLEGDDRELVLSGRLTVQALAVHLIRPLPAGAVLDAGDIELRQVPLRFAEAGGLPTLEQLVGKQLQRASRAGVMLKSGDVSEPELIARNDVITLTFRNGPMTLTAKGQALDSASAGQVVSVLNLASRKIVQGIATASGTVDVSFTGATEVAALYP